jgi:hypothetical protein
LIAKVRKRERIERRMRKVALWAVEVRSLEGGLAEGIRMAI